MRACASAGMRPGVFHIGVDVRIGHPQGVFVGERRRSSSRSAVGHLPPRGIPAHPGDAAAGRPGACSNRKAAPGRRAVAKFGEKARDVLRRMIRANDQEFLFARRAAYWAIMRSLALILPLLKSVSFS